MLAQALQSLSWISFHQKEVVCPCHSGVVSEGEKSTLTLCLALPGNTGVGAIVKDAHVCQEQLTLTSSHLLQLQKELGDSNLLPLTHLGLNLHSGREEAGVEWTSTKVPRHLISDL